VPSDDIAATRHVLLSIIENLARDEHATDMRMPSTRDLARLKAGSKNRRKRPRQ
jgi:hypothetical protein